MKNMTIGNKITLGFGTLILIATLLGGLAIVNMKSVQTQSKKLATEYVPETQIATDLGNALADVQLGVRSYGLTADNAYLDAARKSLVDLHKQQQAAQKLADEHPNLIKLREHLKDLEPALKSYEDFITQTEAKNKEIVTDRDKLNKMAADFILNIDKLIDGQVEKAEKEIKAFTEAGKLQQRLHKLMLATEIRGEGNAARIAVFKSQALRDPKVIEDGLKNFEVMDKNFEELFAMLTVQEDIAELNKVKEDAHVYRDTMKEIMADNLALVDLGKKRLEAATRVETLAHETRTAGMTRTVEAANASNQTLASSSWILIAGLIVALVVGVGVAYMIVRGTNKVLTNISATLDDGANQLATAAGQVSSASQTLAEGASEQAASLEETSASLEEMTSMVKRNAEAAGKAKILAGETRTAADAGTTDMAEMKTAMSEIKVSSSEVAKIVKDIDEIAFQTNILALNAAVEAARAGEAGAGFAVVADEVRNLAQRSAASAKQTAAKIEDAIAKSERGVQISNKVAVSFEQIATKTREVDQYVAEIANASNEQAQGVSQVNIAITQMDKVTQSNAATAEESAAAAEELKAQAESVKESVLTLQQLVGGTSGAATTERAATPGGRTIRHKPAVGRNPAPVSVKGNGASHRGNGVKQLITTGPASKGEEIPMDGDFKNF
ncbi:MAG: chemotaxis protein [Pedosphaera sp.]|nr:chemotaxis protein [Pedosphaera sp.]